jgi:hypothetical protein
MRQLDTLCRGRNGRQKTEVHHNWRFQNWRKKNGEEVTSGSREKAA